jgi:hypothetical protein
VPTDWSLWLVYDSAPNTQGVINLASWTEEITTFDKWYINNDWKPTTCFFGDTNRF